MRAEGAGDTAMHGAGVDEVRIVVDGIEVLAAAGQNVLGALLSHGVYVPHMCSDKNGEHCGFACRLCFVEMAGCERPVCACEVAVREGLDVVTGTRRCAELARRALSLLASEHDADCANCTQRTACPFREIATYLDVPLGSLLHRHAMTARQPGEPPYADDETQSSCDARTDCGIHADCGAPPTPSVPRIALDVGKCILCGACCHACAKAGYGFIAFHGRGPDVRISIDSDAYADGSASCAQCATCVDACPVGALSWKS